MPNTLDKTRKRISKKRGGLPNALHEKSRDSLRLHKAGVRDQRLEKLAAARGKKEQPILDRVAFFQDCVREKEGALDLETVQQQIEAFIHQYDDEYNSIKKARRPGRPATAREDILKMKIAALQTEHEQGFALPDVMTAEHAASLDNWEGSWSYLAKIPWIKVSNADQVRPADFPSKGLS